MSSKDASNTAECVSRHEMFMLEAYAEALKAQSQGEVPVGAVIVSNGKIIARGHNLRVNDFDATAHAEVVVIRKAGKTLGRWNLSDCDLYVTLEPCAMCAGACINARIRNIFYAADDPRFGCCGTLINLAAFEKLNHRCNVVSGIMAEECGTLLSNHFKMLRSEKKFNDTRSIQ